VAKHLIDTDLYIDLIQSGTSLPFIREIYDKDAPGIYFSSVVAQELLVSARTLPGRKRVEILFRPFERVGRVVTPTHSHWKDAGDYSSGFARQTNLRNKLAAWVNDLFAGLERSLAWRNLVHQESR
jgi:hypothetical protein